MMKIKKILVKFLYPLAKMAKPYLKNYVEEKVIPYLQEKVNAGAIDKQVDGIIKETLTELINKI